MGRVADKEKKNIFLRNQRKKKLNQRMYKSKARKTKLSQAKSRPIYVEINAEQPNLMKKRHYNTFFFNFFIF